MFVVFIPINSADSSICQTNKGKHEKSIQRQFDFLLAHQRVARTFHLGKFKTDITLQGICDKGFYITRTLFEFIKNREQIL